MTFVIATIVVLLTFITGALFAWIVKSVDSTVVKTKDNIDNADNGYNPALTMGHRINSQAGAQEQIKEARLASAKAAAALPRGANMRIVGPGSSALESASQALNEDPWTASKIAQYHGWDGAKAGIPAGGVPEAGAAVATAAAPAAAGKIELVPGKDYPVIEINDDMSPDEKRKARIANSKAKSAAMKAAKAAGAPAAAVASTAAPIAVAPAAPDPVAAGIEPPKFIVITDDMSPDEVRKARIANSKAKSAFNKSLKSAGIDPKTVNIDDQGNIVMPEGVTPAVPPAAAVPVATTETTPPTPAPSEGGSVDLAALGISPPEVVELTDDMTPDEKRQARIANSKAKSAFNKALKDAGIDPKTVQL